MHVQAAPNLPARDSEISMEHDRNGLRKSLELVQLIVQAARKKCFEASKNVLGVGLERVSLLGYHLLFSKKRVG